MASSSANSGSRSPLPGEFQAPGLTPMYTSVEGVGGRRGSWHRVSESPTPPDVAGERQEIVDELSFNLREQPMGKRFPPTVSQARVVDNMARPRVAPQSNITSAARNNSNRNLISESSEPTEATPVVQGMEDDDRGGQVLGAVALLLLAASKTSPKPIMGKAKGKGDVHGDSRSREAAGREEPCITDGASSSACDRKPTVVAHRRALSCSPSRSRRSSPTWRVRASPPSPRIAPNCFPQSGMTSRARSAVSRNRRQGGGYGNASGARRLDVSNSGSFLGSVEGNHSGGRENGACWRAWGGEESQHARFLSFRPSPSSIPSASDSRFPANEKFAPGSMTSWNQGVKAEARPKRVEAAIPTFGHNPCYFPSDVISPITKDAPGSRTRHRDNYRYEIDADWVPKNSPNEAPNPQARTRTPFADDHMERPTERKLRQATFSTMMATDPLLPQTSSRESNREALATAPPRGRRSPSPPRAVGRTKPEGYRGGAKPAWATTGQARQTGRDFGRGWEAQEERSSIIAPRSTRWTLPSYRGSSTSEVNDVRLSKANINPRVLTGLETSSVGFKNSFHGNTGDGSGGVRGHYSQKEEIPEDGFFREIGPDGKFTEGCSCAGQGQTHMSPKRGTGVASRKQQQQKKQGPETTNPICRKDMDDLGAQTRDDRSLSSAADAQPGRQEGIPAPGAKEDEISTPPQKKRRAAAKKPLLGEREDGEPPKLRRTCDYCTEKNTGCTGGQPCQLCTRKGIVCVFSTTHKQRQGCEESPKVLNSHRPATMDLDEQVSDSSSEHGSASGNSRRPSPRKKGNNLVWSQFRKACDRCTDKKVRCDGSNPTGGFKACTPCKRAGESCLFGICRRSGPRDKDGHKTAVAGVIMKRDDFEKVTERLGQCRTEVCRFVNEDGSFWREHFHCRIGDCSFAGKNMSALLLHRGTDHPERPTGTGTSMVTGRILTSEVVTEASVVSEKTRGAARGGGTL